MAFERKQFLYDTDGDGKENSFSYGDYTAGESVTNANNALTAHLATKPGGYQSQWQQQLKDTMDKILNREKFSYDVNGDALYNQYKTQYMNQGKLAMQDTMGQAAAMTGGYGNSYAATAGNQAYQQHLNQLNNVIPELYQLAYNQYTQEGQDLYNQYGLISDRDNTEYGRHRDTVSDWQNDRNYYSDMYNNERTFDYGKWSDGRTLAYDMYSDDKTLAYNEHDASQNIAYDEYVRAEAEKAAAANASSGSGGGGGNGIAKPVNMSATQEANFFNYLNSDDPDYSAAENYLNYLKSTGVDPSITAQLYGLYIAPHIEEEPEVEPPKVRTTTGGSGRTVFQKHRGIGYMIN